MDVQSLNPTRGSFPIPPHSFSPTSVPVSSDLSYHNKGKKAKKKRERNCLSSNQWTCVNCNNLLTLPSVEKLHLAQQASVNDLLGLFLGSTISHSSNGDNKLRAVYTLGICLSLFSLVTKETIFSKLPDWPFFAKVDWQPGCRCVCWTWAFWTKAYVCRLRLPVATCPGSLTSRSRS